MSRQEPTTCNQDGCENPGAFRFTWPGRDEAHICEEHEPRLRAIANALGLHLQVIPLGDAHPGAG